jgi:integrase
MKAIFGAVKTTDVRSADIRAYRNWCRGEAVESSSLLRGRKPIERPLAKGTVNRDLAILCRAYSLGIEVDSISYKPKFKKYSDRETIRKGFMEQHEYDAIMALNLPLWLRALACVAYTVGNRRGELSNLRVGQCDFLNRIVRLEVGETKNDEGRIAPMTQQMFHLLQACCVGKKASDYVFTREDRNLPSRQVGDFRKLWANVVKEAGIERRILIHDLRRSAVKNMTERGVDRDVAKAISGHKTDSVFTRYNIVNSKRVLAAVAKIEAGAQAERELANQASGPKSGQSAECSIGNESQVAVN